MNRILEISDSESGLKEKNREVLLEGKMSVEEVMRLRTFSYLTNCNKILTCGVSDQLVEICYKHTLTSL